jgi:acetyl-CoA carboxylase biotin carboxyl carrier protein
MDIRHIKNLVELMVENDLDQLEIQEGETHILLKRGPKTAAGSAPPVVAVSPATAAAGAWPEGSAAASNPAGEAIALTDAAPTEAQETYVRSPMVGTFYVAPDPESPPFVQVGDTVQPDTVVCLVEAMKVFNEIKAEVSGRLTRALVKNAQAVEYDQPLFAVRPV